MRLVSILLVVSSVASAACGKSSEPAPPATPSAAPTTASAPAPKASEPKDKEVATGNTLTEFQKTRLLGHYSTQDGASGFILDRTVTPWRAKLDGTSKVVTMEERNEPKRGEKEFKSSDGAIWIRVDMESGHVLGFQGPKQHEGVRIVRDADADPLK